jgi:hypothetical protein
MTSVSVTTPTGREFGELATYARCVLASDITVIALRRLASGATETHRERQAGSPVGDSLSRSRDSEPVAEGSAGRSGTSGLGGPPGSKVTFPKKDRG